MSHPACPWWWCSTGLQGWGSSSQIRVKNDQIGNDGRQVLFCAAVGIDAGRASGGDGNGDAPKELEVSGGPSHPICPQVLSSCYPKLFPF